MKDGSVHLNYIQHVVAPVDYIWRASSKGLPTDDECDFTCGVGDEVFDDSTVLKLVSNRFNRIET